MASTLRFHRFVGPWILGLAAAACGGGGTAPADAGRADGGVADAAREDAGGSGEDAAIASDADTRDASAREDAGPLEDAGADAGGESDAGAAQDACLPPPCAAPPPGCAYVGSDPCSCGTLVCASDCSVEPCAPTEFCELAVPLSCGGPGTCRPRPEMCTAILAPVCGCDGASYGNACTANANGTDVASEGECPVTSDCRTTGCSPPQTCEPCRGIGGLVYVCLPPGTAC